MDLATVVERARQAPSSPDTLRRSDFESSSYSGTGDAETVLEIQAEQPLAFRNGVEYDLTFIAFELFTTDATGGNTETFALSHDLTDAASVDPNVVAYIGTDRVAPDDVRVDANEVDLTDPGTDNSVAIFYAVAEQQPLRVRKVGPSRSVSETLIEHDARLLNARDQDQNPFTVDLTQSPLQPIVPSKWRVVIETEGNIGVADPDTQPAVNWLVSLPIVRSPEKIEGLRAAVRQDSSRRT